MLKIKILNKPKPFKLKCNISFPNITESNLQEKEVTPTTNIQEVVADSEFDGLSKVIVDAVTNEIDENIQPSNIKLGVSILGVEGNVEPDKPNQTKEVNPSIEEQIVVPDTGYELSQVKVNGVTSEIDENIISENIKEGVSILGVEGSFVGGSGKYAPRALSFYYYAGTELDYELANVDTSNLTTMQYMFSNCSNLLSVDLSKLDTSNVTNMGMMFAECRKLTEVDLSVLDTSKVKGMGNMFNYCTSLQKINLKGINTSSLTGTCMNQMFGNCSSLKEIDMSSFNTSKADSLSSLFTSCTSLEHIDVSSFNTSNVTNMGSVFNKCNSLTTLDISNFDAGKVYNINNMFANCTSLANLTFMNNLGQGYTRASSNYSQYTLNLSACPLTHDSLMDVINKLATLGSYKQSLILGANNLSKLTADEIAIATSKNWNVS